MYSDGTTISKSMDSPTISGIIVYATWLIKIMKRILWETD